MKLLNNSIAYKEISKDCKRSIKNKKYNLVDYYCNEGLWMSERYKGGIIDVATIGRMGDYIRFINNTKPVDHIAVERGYIDSQIRKKYFVWLKYSFRKYIKPMIIDIYSSSKYINFLNGEHAELSQYVALFIVESNANGGHNAGALSCYFLTKEEAREHCRSNSVNDKSEIYEALSQFSNGDTRWHIFKAKDVMTFKFN